MKKHRFLSSLLLLLALATLWPLVEVAASVDLLYFRAEATTQRITLRWATGAELDHLGFRILRNTNDNRSTATVISPLIPATNNINGSTYEYEDQGAQARTIYYYWLESIDVNSQSQFEGPIQAALASGSLIVTPTPGSGQGSATATPTATPSSTVAATKPADTPAPAATTPPTSPPPTATNSAANPTATAASNPVTVNNPTAAPVAPDAGNGETPADSAPPAVGEPGDATTTGAAEANPAGDAAQALAANPTATDGEESPVRAIGANVDSQGNRSLPPPADTVESPAGADEGPSPAVVMALLVGLALTISGGAATWFLVRRGRGGAG